MLLPILAISRQVSAHLSTYGIDGTKHCDCSDWPMTVCTRDTELFGVACERALTCFYTVYCTCPFNNHFCLVLNFILGTFNLSSEIIWSVTYVGFILWKSEMVSVPNAFSVKIYLSIIFIQLVCFRQSRPLAYVTVPPTECRRISLSTVNEILQ